jgi:hypothetical protein
MGMVKLEGEEQQGDLWTWRRGGTQSGGLAGTLCRGQEAKLCLKSPG